MTESGGLPAPSTFIADWLRERTPDRGTRPRALDLACGRGRHAVPLAGAGYDVFAIDIQFDALLAAREAAASRAVHLHLACADLTSMPLPPGTFDLIVVTRYLDRHLFPALRASLAPGGVLLYETFTEHQLRYDRGPRSRSHLLAPGELRMLVQGMDVLFDEEVVAPEAVARIAARRRA